MRNGKEYKFKFDENIFFSSPFHFLYPKVREELGIYLDCIELKYNKLTDAFTPPKSEYSYSGEKVNKNNDKILKRKKAKKKVQNKKKH
jgi:hypothetical protein